MKFFHTHDGTLVLDVPDSVYYPQEDSLLLAKVIETIELSGKKALDMGCGSGLLAIIMAKNGAVVTAADIDETAIETTKRNAKANGVELKTVVSDMFENITGKYGLIVFNPPYLPTDEKSLQYSGGKTGRDVIERFIRSVKKFLAPHGIVVILISSLTGEHEVRGLLEESFSVKVVAREKIPWEELVVLEVVKEDERRGC